MTNRVTDILGITYPIIQAPMAWVTNAELVAAVSNAGGLGTLGPNAGQDTLTTDIVETAERMRNEIRKVQALTDKPFALNIFAPPADAAVADIPFTSHTLQVGFDEGVKVFAVVGGVHEELFKMIKDYGGTLIYRPANPSIALMQEAERLGADVLVATGREEGGILPGQEYGTFTVVPAMVDAVTIPVMAAGGINDTRGVNAAFALGAEGVYIGTRFLMTKESPMADNTKTLVMNSGWDDMVAISYSQRSIETPKAKELAAEYQASQDNLAMNQKITALGGMRPGMLAGDFDAGIVSVNTGIDIIKDIPTVSELILRLMADQA
jgi:enoyl-[acyl-carrier protein] reductase II